MKIIATFLKTEAIPVLEALLLICFYKIIKKFLNTVFGIITKHCDRDDLKKQTNPFTKMNTGHKIGE